MADAIERVNELWEKTTERYLGWKVYKKKIPVNDLGRTEGAEPVTEISIHTEKNHPQLKAPAPIITTATGPYHSPNTNLFIDENDAAFIVAIHNAWPQILAEYRALKAKAPDGWCIICDPTHPVGTLCNSATRFLHEQLEALNRECDELKAWIKCPHPMSEYYHGQCTHCPNGKTDREQQLAAENERLKGELKQANERANGHAAQSIELITENLNLKTELADARVCNICGERLACVNHPF